MKQPDPLSPLRTICQGNEHLELAVLIGSRVTGRGTAASDWDIALQWRRGMDIMQQLAQTETLRNQTARQLNVSDNKIDLINIPTAGLAMQSVIADEGVLLKGVNTLAWSHFLLRTWRNLEEFYWDQLYTA